MKRKVNAIWKGDGNEGIGVLSTQSGAISNMPYSFTTRFKNDDGKLGTNPEELIAAALSGCFNMKLAFVLNENGYNPDELATEAELTFIDGVITQIDMNLNGKVPNLNQSSFEDFANEAKNNCPISGVLNCRITLNTKLL